jgi:hypothetical protein
MKASFLRQYRSSKSGNIVFVYGVTGSAAELETYANVQGDNLRTDEKTGKSLFFSNRFFGKSGDLIITDAGKVVADMSHFDQQASLVAQFGGDFGKALADAAAAALLGNKPSTDTPE